MPRKLPMLALIALSATLLLWTEFEYSLHNREAQSAEAPPTRLPRIRRPQRHHRTPDNPNRPPTTPTDPPSTPTDPDQ